jgi:hypothetical protein
MSASTYYVNIMQPLCRIWYQRYPMRHVALVSLVEGTVLKQRAENSGNDPMLDMTPKWFCSA